MKIIEQTRTAPPIITHWKQRVHYNFRIVLIFFFFFLNLENTIEKDRATSKMQFDNTVHEF